MKVIFTFLAFISFLAAALPVEHAVPSPTTFERRAVKQAEPTLSVLPIEQAKPKLPVLPVEHATRSPITLRRRAGEQAEPTLSALPVAHAAPTPTGFVPVIVRDESVNPDTLPSGDTTDAALPADGDLPVDNAAVPPNWRIIPKPIERTEWCAWKTVQECKDMCQEWGLGCGKCHYYGCQCECGSPFHQD